MLATKHEVVGNFKRPPYMLLNAVADNCYYNLQSNLNNYLVNIRQ